MVLHRPTRNQQKMKNRPPRKQHPTVISDEGERATRIVGLFRILSAIGIGGAMVAIGRLFDGGGSRAGTIALVFAVVAGLFAFAEISYGGRAARAEERRVRKALLERYFTLRPSTEKHTDDAGPAKAIQMMTDNVERLTEYRQVYFGATLAAIAIPFVALLYVGIFIDPVIGFTVMIFIPLIPILIGGFMRFFRKTSAESRRERSHLAGRYLDAIRNLVVIRLLGAGPRVEHDLSEQGEANRGAIMRLLAGNQIVIIVMDGLFGLVLICLTAALTITRADHLTNAQVLAVMLITILLLEPLQQVAGFFYIGMGGIASQRALRAYLADEVTAPSPSASVASAASATRETDTDRSPTPGLAVEIRDVHFDYGRGPVLRGVDLTVPAGSRVAIMGRSGAGKSTLMGLLQGSLSPQDGFIAVDGHVLDSVDLTTTRSLSATVAQSTWMFTGTIADNLRIARAEATDEEIWAALEQAQVADEIAGMPSGLSTYLGEGAALISGGQAQRISLARALLSGRKVLFLDEPTSQVDMESEARIVTAVAALPTDRTVVMVTHRPSLLESVESAYRMVDGRLEQMELEGMEAING